MEKMPRHQNVLMLLLIFSIVVISPSCGQSSLANNTEQDSIPDNPSSSTARGISDDNGEVADDEYISFAFVGDVMMGTTFPDSVRGTHLPANDGRDLFSNCTEIIKSADVACLNLEGTLLDGVGHRRKMKNPATYYIFRMPTKYVDNLVAAGFDFAGIANNHINDFGAPGRKSTVNTLQKSGLKHSGLRGVNEIAVLERKGLRIAVAQFGHGGNNLSVNDMNELERVINNMRDTADIVVVSFHGGAEGTKHTHVPFAVETFVGEKRGNVAAFAHKAIDLGADIVYGHGPHVPRAVELYNDRLIIYSLGNFCTPYRMNITGISGYAPLITVNTDRQGRFVSGKIHSFKQRRGAGPVKDSSCGAATLIRRLTVEDFPKTPLTITNEGDINMVR